MKLRVLLTSIIASGAFMAAWASPVPSILTIKETISDTAIVYPESFETDTRIMRENWYLRNYTALDTEINNIASDNTSDEVFIERLKAMPTEIEMPYNQIVRSYIEMYITRRRDLVETMLGMSMYYMPIFEQALEKEGLPLELKYLPVIESALNPVAVSRAGATGLWQFMIGTAKGLGLEVNTLVDERRDPYRSSEMAARYLKELYGIYGDWSLAIAAYNCGPGNVNKALRRASADDDDSASQKDFWEIYYYLPRETRGYVPAFIAANYVMTYFKCHGISPGLAKKPLITDTISIDRRVHFNQISAVLNMPVDEIRALNPQYRKDVIPGNTHPYKLILPSQQVYSYIMSEDSILAYDNNKYAVRSVANPVDYSNEGGNYERKLVTKYHKVRRGESLSVIARKYGVTVSSIKRANGLRGDGIQRGQLLKISSYQRVRVKNDDAQQVAENTEKKKSTTQKKKSTANYKTRKHKVKSGETLSGIAMKYRGVTVADIRRANGIRGSRIRAGQTLLIPIK